MENCLVSDVKWKPGIRRKKKCVDIWLHFAHFFFFFFAVLLKTTCVATVLSNPIINNSCGSNLWPLNCDWPFAHRGENLKTFSKDRINIFGGSGLGCALWSSWNHSRERRDIVKGEKGIFSSTWKTNRAFPLRLSEYFLIHLPLMGDMTPLLQASSSSRTQWDHLTT